MQSSQSKGFLKLMIERWPFVIRSDDGLKLETSALDDIYIVKQLPRPNAAPQFLFNPLCSVLILVSSSLLREKNWWAAWKWYLPPSMPCPKRAYLCYIGTQIFFCSLLKKIITIILQLTQ